MTPQHNLLRILRTARDNALAQLNDTEPRHVRRALELHAESMTRQIQTISDFQRVEMAEFAAHDAKVRAFRMGMDAADRGEARDNNPWHWSAPWGAEWLRGFASAEREG